MWFIYVFVFGVHHKDWLTYFGGADRLGELSFLKRPDSDD